MQRRSNIPDRILEAIILTVAALGFLIFLPFGCVIVTLVVIMSGLYSFVQVWIHEEPVYRKDTGEIPANELDK